MLQVSAPGRVCLFGEHQDYLKLSVIPAAITKRCYIQGDVNTEGEIRLDDRVYNQVLRIPFDINHRKNGYVLKNGEYLKAVVNVFIKTGLLDRKNPNLGFNGKLQNNVPQKSGLSSSAALLVAFTKLIDEIFQLNLDEIEIGMIAYKAEHDEMGIPCGQMDQLAASIGNIFHMECLEPPKIQKMSKNIQGLVVGDTLIPKSTNNVHSVRVKEISDAINFLSIKTEFNIKTTSYEEIKPLIISKNPIWHKRIRATIYNRDITTTAFVELKKSYPDLEVIGSLLNQHQKYLREDYEVSVKKIDDMIEAGIKAGALGGKLTGAGMGGSIIMLAPGKQEEVAQALTKAGGKGYVVDIDEGVTSLNTY